MTARSVIAIVGPICAGKSTLSARFVVAHPEWAHLSIDACRSVRENQAKAWVMLCAQSKRATLALLESSGVSDSLRWAFATKAVEVTAPVEVLLRRLSERPRGWSRFAGSLDPRQSVRYVRQNLRRLCPVPIAASISTDCGEDEAFERFEAAVLLASRGVGA